MENGVSVKEALETIQLHKLYSVYVNGKLACTHTEEDIAYKLYCDLFPNVQMIDMRYDTGVSKANKE